MSHNFADFSLNVLKGNQTSAHSVVVEKSAELAVLQFESCLKT